MGTYGVDDYVQYVHVYMYLYVQTVYCTVSSFILIVTVHVDTNTYTDLSPSESNTD